MNPPTLPELRQLLDDLSHETENQGGKDSLDGAIFHVAEKTLRWLLAEYLRPGTFVPRDDP